MNENNFIKLLLAVRKQAVKDYRKCKAGELHLNVSPKKEWNESLCKQLLETFLEIQNNGTK